jgi:hypothetical protein
VEKYSKAGQSTDDNLIRRMRSACLITKATNTHSEHIILLFFQGNNDYKKAPCVRCVRILPVLLGHLISEKEYRYVVTADSFMIQAISSQNLILYCSSSRAQFY